MLNELVATPLCRLLRDCGLPLAESEIADWERSLPGPLPADYRLFLKTYNGGKCFDNVVYELGLRGIPGRAGFSSLGAFSFYGLNMADWAIWRDLMEQRQTHEGRIPEGTIPIGESGGDNEILVDVVRGGELVLWERDAEGAVERNVNRIPIARTFLEFARGVAIEPLKERRRYTLAEKEPFISIEAHDLEGLQKWVAKKGPLEKLPGGGIELLRAACDGGDFAGAEWLLEQGVDSTGPLEKGMQTPIEIADSSGSGDIVVLLLEHGADAKHLRRGRRRPQPYIAAFAEQWKAGLRKSRRTV